MSVLIGAFICVQACAITSEYASAAECNDFSNRVNSLQTDTDQLFYISVQNRARIT